MILFDYGQTLVQEQKFNSKAGYEAVLQYAVKNTHNHTAEEVQAASDAINDELGRRDPARRKALQFEISNDMFTTYLFESLGITLSLNPKEIDSIFWNAAAPGTATDGMPNLLSYLKSKRIRTGVISNLVYDNTVLRERINSILPEHAFEFIIATSEYLFRKPNKRIFQLALEKAGLRAEDVWYVGDNYEYDVCGSRNAGLFPVWYIGATEHPVGEYDALTISSWNELIQWIDSADSE